MYATLLLKEPLPNYLLFSGKFPTSSFGFSEGFAPAPNYECKQNNFENLQIEVKKNYILIH